jgi:translocation and assembly module TamA
MVACRGASQPELGKKRASRSRWLATRWLLPSVVLCGTLMAPQLAAQPRPALEIEGGTDEQARNIRLVTAVENRRCELSPRREAPLLRDLEDKALTALRALGFYEPALELEFERTETCWQVRILLEPGPPTLLTGIDIRISGDGAEDPNFKTIIDDPQLPLNTAIRHDRYDALRDRLARVASENGYFDAFFLMARLEINREDRTATARLHFATGERYRFGEIRIEQDILSDEFVARLLPFSRGDDYATARVILLQRNLAGSRYFQNVQVRPLIEEREDGEIPVSIRTEPRKPTAYEVRIGLSTDLGPRAGLALDRRYANTRGHRFNSELELSSRRSSLGAAYEIPLNDPLRERLNLFGTIRTESIDDADSDRFQIGAERIVVLRSGWQATTGLRYEYERFALSNPTQTSKLLIPSVRIHRSKTDDPLWTRSGYRAEATVQGASRQLGSSENFFQTRLSGKWIEGLGSGRVHIRADAAATLSSDFDRVPASLRYFAGGDNSVRGYGFQRLSPRAEDGRIVGGRYLLVGGVEWDHPIGTTPLLGAIFIDAGNAFDELSAYNAKHGYGVGLRWRSPIGPLRLDLARAPDSEDRFRIHFTMGPDL